MTTPDEPRDDQPKRRMPWDVPPEQAPGRPSPDTEDTAVFSAQRHDPQEPPQEPPPPYQAPRPQPAAYPQSYPQAPQSYYGETPKTTKGGLGTAALVLGIVAIVLLLVCGIGLLVAITGVIVGIVAIVKKSNKGRAVVGLILSILTLVIGAIIIAVVVNWANKNNIAECFDTRLHPTQESSQQCVQRKLNAPVSEGGY
ncbi:hypothetical protein [Herbidospora sp. RD11066]